MRTLIKISISLLFWCGISAAQQPGFFGANHTVAASTCGTPSFTSPSPGSFSSTQTPTITTSGCSTICYNLTQATITVVTPGTCPAGTTTLSSGSTVTVSSTTNFGAVGTQSGYTTSAQNNVTYTISSGPPTYVNSAANYCVYSGGACPGPNISVTAGNSLLAYLTLFSQASCASAVPAITAKLSGGNSLTQIGVNISAVGGAACSAQFYIASLPTTTSTEYVVFTYSGGGSYASIGEVQSTAFTTVDASCSGTSISSPTACASGMTVSSDLIFSAYSDAYTGGTVGVGGGFTGGASYAGSTGFATTLYTAYQRVTSSGTYTPSYTDSSGSITSTVFGAAVH